MTAEEEKKRPCIICGRGGRTMEVCSVQVHPRCRDRWFAHVRAEVLKE